MPILDPITVHVDNDTPYLVPIPIAETPPNRRVGDFWIVVIQNEGNSKIRIANQNVTTDSGIILDKNDDPMVSRLTGSDQLGIIATGGAGADVSIVRYILD